MGGADRGMTGRRTRRTIGLIALVGALLAGLLPGAALAASPDPRVVFVVGPVGSLTESYRRWARAGAEEARRHTADVVEVYSPNATWPKVRAALQGASIVVYLGHGNGFPSPYGTKLRRSVQDGFGLNPVAGRGDSTHQYFGEGVVADQVHLASGAVVLFFHLCYASGLAEPGVPEGTESTARQRVDNYAAGFLAAGASAVIADAYGSPAPYMRALLGSKVSARTAWTRAGTANGNVRAFASERTAGAVALMDPERSSGGFSRSLVLAAGTAGMVPAGPVRGTRTPAGGWEVVVPPISTPAPEAFSLGARPGAPTLDGMPIAGSTVRLNLPVEVTADAPLRNDYRIGTRWVPLDDAAAAPAAPVEPGPGDESAVVAEESAASLVDVEAATTAGTVVSAPVTLPPTIGRYRLEVTVHDGDGVALSYSVQAAIPGVVVHVGGPGAGWVDAPAALSLTAGTQASVQVVVTNGEATPWGGCLGTPDPLIADPAAASPASCPTVRLVGRWVPVGGQGTAAPMTRDLTVPAATAASTWLAGPVPALPGTYLLVASLERATGAGPVQIVGRPVTITVEVTSVPLVPTPGGLTPAPIDPIDPLAPGEVTPAPIDPLDPLAPTFAPAPGG